MPSPRRVRKMHEFYAHSAPINCAHIGRASYHVLASGADDCCVNVWRIGRPQPLMSLAGHSTEIDSVQFNATETTVTGGSRGGSIKVWDLTQERLARTLAGHRAAVKCLHHHPYGEFLASGSLDTNLKIWDLRSKACLQTYKGHAAALTVVRHSPDGKWVVSGDAAGTVKVWDLTAGRLVKEFKNVKREAITSLQFHPHEFLLAIGSASRKVNFWDMESFALIAHTHHEATPIEHVAFDPDGAALLAATLDTLKVWQWEPSVVCADTLGTNWGPRLVDMTVSGAREVIGVSVSKTVIAIHHADLRSVRPWMDGKHGSNKQGSPGTRRARPHDVQAPRPASAKPKAHDFNANLERGFVNLESQPSPPRADPVGPALTRFQRDDPTPAHDTTAAAAALLDHTLVAAEGPSDAPLGLSVSAFMPKQQTRADIAATVDPAALCASALKEHSVMCTILAQRRSNLRVLHSFWARGDISACVNALVQMDDLPVAVDWLNQAEPVMKGNLLTLGVCVAVLPLLKNLLLSRFEGYVATSLRYVHLLLLSFSDVIATSVSSRGTGLVNIVLEERRGKCQACFVLFRDMRPVIHALAEKRGKAVSITAAEVSQKLDAFLKSAQAR